MTITTSSVDQVIIIWSSHGHRFLGADVPEDDCCLTCGAVYRLTADATDPRSGRYSAANGDEPTACTGDTRMVHGYPGEGDCETCGNSGCEHCRHDCNCLFCV